MHLTAVWSAVFLFYFISFFFSLLSTISPATPVSLPALCSFFLSTPVKKDMSELWDPARPLKMVLNCYFFFQMERVWGGGAGGGLDKWCDRFPNFTSRREINASRTVESEKKRQRDVVDGRGRFPYQGFVFPGPQNLCQVSAGKWFQAQWLREDVKMFRKKKKKKGDQYQQEQSPGKPRGKLPTGRCKKIAACSPGREALWTLFLFPFPFQANERVSKR